MKVLNTFCNLLTDSTIEILEDVKEECAKYGPVQDVKMPRPSSGSRQTNGVGKIYIKYEDPASAQKALRALAGRKFSDRGGFIPVESTAKDFICLQC